MGINPSWKPALKRVVHSDNICTVGVTCITALMNADDMRSLLDVCPDGDFTPCFFAPSVRSWEWSPEVLERYERDEAIFYFNFKEDERGEKLLRMLFSEGREDEHGRKYTHEIIL